MIFWQLLCGGILGSRSITVRRRCGTAQGSGQTCATDAQVWRGSMLPTDRQGVKVLRTPLGQPHYVARHLQGIVEEHHTLLDRIPHVKDLQCAWLLLLHCASARANFQLRTVDPASTGEFSEAHDQGIWQCLCNILQIDPTQAQTVKDIASLPLVSGGLVLRSARRTRVPAHWASWGLHTDDSRKTPHSGRAVGATIGGASCDHLFARSCVGWPFLRRCVGMESTVLESPC